MDGSKPFTRRVAPNIRERHARSCGRSTGRGRCTCEPQYQARVFLAGVEYCETFDDLAASTTWVRELRRAAADGRIGAGPTPMLGQAAVRFLVRAREGVALTRSRRAFSENTLRAYERELRLHVLEHRDERTGRRLGDMQVDEIDARTLQRFVDALSARTSAESARHAVAALTSLLRDLYTQGVLDTLPPKLLLPSPGAPRDRVLTLPQFEQLLTAAQEDDAARGLSRMYPFVALLGGSGCRISELLALRWGAEGLDLGRSPPRLSVARATTKTDAGRRVVPLDPEVAEVLRAHCLRTNATAGDLVFPTPSGRAASRSGVYRVGLRRVSIAAGLEPITPHVLRHSHATWAASANVPAIALAVRLGHADASFTLRRYIHAAQADLDAIPAAILALRRAQTPPAPKPADPKEQV